MPRVISAAGAVAEVAPLPAVALHEVVRVGPRGLLGEVIRIRGDVATVQVFEDTVGLALEDEVVPTGAPLTAELGPGLLGAVLDGIGRPLRLLAERQGAFLDVGVTLPTLDHDRQWVFQPLIAPGASVAGGDVIGTVEERHGITHRIMVPPGVMGTVAQIEQGEYRVTDPVAVLADGTPLTLLQRWPLRHPRPIATWLRPDRPFVTGQRIFDLLFPVAEGGTVAVPGGFGTGKTVIEQSLAKYADADIVVFVGCGERGNEMAEVLEEFPRLDDPRTGRTLMDRTVLVVNTSNMPVAARESSVLLGLTVAEYYRDMGYRVALLADSLSRWAEALREIGSRLREMPGEEGYPTALGSRLAKLFERAGRVRAVGRPEREGALTLISALSPPGGDFSEPVTQAALRVAAALWALDVRLAHQRQFPAVDWEISYSLQTGDVVGWFEREGGEGWTEYRRTILELLQRDRELREVVGLVGPEALDDRDRLVLAAAALVRDLLLGQSAFDPTDQRSPVRKTHRLAELVCLFYHRAIAALEQGVPLQAVDVSRARHAIAALRAAPPEEVESRAEAARAEVHAAARLGGGTG
jgi:V/A-type H+-transporting ATPase subunit A